MSLDAIRDTIMTLLTQADPAAQVHDYERWTTDPQTVLELFRTSLQGDQHLHAWVFKPVSCSTAHFTQDSDLVSYVFLFRFVYSLVDVESTEKVAWRAIETVRRRFRGHPLLADVVELAAAAEDGPLRGKPGLQVEKLDVITFANVLCHYGELRLAVAELQSINET